MYPHQPPPQPQSLHPYPSTATISPPHHAQQFNYSPQQQNVTSSSPLHPPYPLHSQHVPTAPHPPHPAHPPFSSYSPYPPGGMSPALTNLFNAYSPSRPDMQTVAPPPPPPPAAAESSAPFGSYSPYSPPPPGSLQPPIPQSQRSASTPDNGGISPPAPPGVSLLSRSSSYTVSPSSLTLLTSEIGSFPRTFDAAACRLIAANRQFVCYSVANGHIRVIGAMTGKTALLKGHSGKVLDMEMATERAGGGGGGSPAGPGVDRSVTAAVLLASVSSGGECFVWSLHQKGDELLTSVRLSLRTGAHVKDGYCRRVLWAQRPLPSSSPSSSASPGKITLISSESVDLLQLPARDQAETTELTNAGSRRLFAGPVTDASFGHGEDGQRLAVSQPSGLVILIDVNSGERYSVTPHVGSNVQRVFFLTASPSRPLTSPFLLTCSIYDNNSTYKLLQLSSRTVLSTLLLSHRAHTITHVAVDPSCSFLIITHTSPDSGEHGLLAVHIRRGEMGAEGDDARFDYVSPYSTSSAVLSFALSNEGTGSVDWDPNTADSVQMYCCCSKPILQFHLPTATIMRKVEASQLMEEKYSEGKQDLKQGDDQQEAQPVQNNSSLLLTPQAIRAASSTTPPSSSSAAAASSSSPPSMSITLTGTTPSSTPSSVVKVLQRPPAINSSVIPSSGGSPSSSPTSSHLAAASLISQSRPSPEIPETPASSPYAGPIPPQLSALATQIPGVISFSSLSTPPPSRKHAGPTHLSPATSPPSTPAPPSRPEQKEVPRTPSSSSSPSPSTVKRKEKETAGTEAVVADDDGSGKEGRRDRQEASLLTRLDKLFLRHFGKVSALVQVQAEKAMAAQREELDRERKDRGVVEKQRTEGLLKVVSQSMQSQLEAVIDKAVPAAISQVVATTLLPQLQSTVTSALSTPNASSSASAVDVDALSASVVASLRLPLQEAFKQMFGSVLLPGFEASTRMMFKQIEDVYVRMSESNEQMLREKAEDWIEQRGRQTDARREQEMMEVKASLNALLTANSAVVQQLTTMQQQQQQHAAHIVELRSLLQSLHHPPVSHPSPSSAHPVASAPPAQPDYKQDISALLESQQYEQAFTRALSLGKVPPVTWLCSQLDPISLLHTTNAAHRLSPAVLLSLIQQLGFSLKEDAAVKLLWIREALMVLDRHDAIISKHVPDVLRGVGQRVDEQLQGQWRDNRQLFDQGRTVKHLLTAMVGGAGPSGAPSQRDQSQLL